MAAELQQVLMEATALLDEKKHFEGVQKANRCFELFELQFGESDMTILKDQAAFLEKFGDKMSDEQRVLLGKLFSLRGQLLQGLGATRRAAAELATAASLLGEEASAEAKKARIEEDEEDDNKVPCSILTGFLGSGKTTLLNYILKSFHGKRIAVIENEFGEVGIDDALVQAGSMAVEEDIVVMNNGCICCTVRGDLIAGLKKLMKSSKSSGKLLDGVLIETTGLADPAPVAQTFFADDYICQHYRLDGILTLVDAKHIVQHLDEEKPEGVENEAVEQIAFADRILLNKCDLVNEEELKMVESRIRAINEPVPIKRTVNSEVDLDFILGIKAFSLDKVLEQEGEFLNDDQDHQHDERVTSVGVDVKGEVDWEKLEKWIGWFLKEKGVDTFRMKGVLAVKGDPKKFVFHAIHMLFSSGSQAEWEKDEEKRCKMIFIGKNLNREELTSGFMKCMA